MTVTINLSDQQVAAIQTQAAEEGITVDVWLQRLAEQHAGTLPPNASKTSSVPIWEKIVDRMKSVPDEVLSHLPVDGASEHDHYLYGSPKRDQ